MEPSAFGIWWSKVHKRTRAVVTLIPGDHLGWSASPDGFSIGGLVRHLATCERYLFVETALTNRSTYSGHGAKLAHGKKAIIALYDRLHQESVACLEPLTTTRFQERCTTPAGAEVRIGVWLQLMLEHEIHHRGQLYLMLRMLDIDTPPLYGLTEEQVQERAWPVQSD